MNIAFAGLRHSHVFALYDLAKQNPNFNIVGAYESNGDALKLAAQRAVECNYKTFDELLNDKKVDVVALGGCFGERGEMAIKALNAGKHVIADKPLCTTLKQLKKIKKAAEKSGKKVSCMFTMRFDEPKISAAKKLFESGALGEINNVIFGGQHPLQYGRRPMWYFEDGLHGGVINDIAIHAVDILSYAFGLKIKTVNAARCWNKYAKEQPNFKDSGQIMLTAKNGAGIMGDVSYAIPDGVEFGYPNYWRFQIFGTLGVLDFSLAGAESVYYLKGDPTPHVLEDGETLNYLDDFYNLINGEDNVILTTNEVFNATETTLKIQQLSK